MIKKQIHKFIRRTHFWRDAGFDELSELYISNLLRSLALTMFSVFVPFFLYQNGYSAVAILTLFASFFVFRACFDIISAYFVARYGPKHTMIISCFAQIVNASLLLTVPSQHWNIFLISFPWALSFSFFFVAYHVTFSKVKHATKSGSELGHMQIFEKIGFLAGPFIGGMVGYIFGPQYIFGAAALLLIASLWPLFLTKEPTKVHQRITFKGLPVSKIKYDLFSNICLGIENTLCINAWAFFVAVFVLSGAVYAQLGMLTALGVLASIVSAKLIGRISDTRLARPLLRTSAVLNSATYIVRPFVNGVVGVFAVNTVNEVVTSGYRMPYIKGLYAAADELPGYRIAYIASMESSDSIAKAAVWAFLAILATVLSLKVVLIVAFGIAAIASLGITKERFAVYNIK